MINESCLIVIDNAAFEGEELLNELDFWDDVKSVVSLDESSENDDDSVQSLDEVGAKLLMMADLMLILS